MEGEIMEGEISEETKKKLDDLGMTLAPSLPVAGKEPEIEQLPRRYLKKEEWRELQDGFNRSTLSLNEFAKEHDLSLAVVRRRLRLRKRYEYQIQVREQSRQVLQVSGPTISDRLSVRANVLQALLHACCIDLGIAPLTLPETVQKVIIQHFGFDACQRLLQDLKKAGVSWRARPIKAEVAASVIRQVVHDLNEIDGVGPGGVRRLLEFLVDQLVIAAGARLDDLVRIGKMTDEQRAMVNESWSLALQEVLTRSFDQKMVAEVMTKAAKEDLDIANA